MDHHQRSKELFQKFINEACTQEELEEFFEYLKQPEYQTEYPGMLQEVWHKMKVNPWIDEKRSDIIFQQITTAHTLTESSGRATHQAWYKHWSVAASLAGILLAAGIVYFFLANDTLFHQTTYGEVRIVELPDHSRITLNGNSTLSYRADWDEDDAEDGIQTREVWLEGEAFFEVEEVMNSAKEKVKFIVHTPQLAVEVVGTTFNVNNRRDETQVVLNSGKVNLYLPAIQQKQKIEMVPGELVKYSEASQAVEQRVVQPQLYSSWKDHQLIFVNTPVREIAEILENTYGYDVVIRDPAIAEKKFNGEITTDQIDVLLRAIASTFGIRVDQDGHKVILQNKE